MTQTPRDWQKDMEMFTAGVEQSRRLGFAATIESSPYQVAIHWLQEAKVYKKSYKGTLTAYTAEKARAEAAEAREQRLKEEIEKCLVAGNSLASVVVGYDLPDGYVNWSYEQASAFFYATYTADVAYERYEVWLAWRAIKDVDSTLYPDTPAQPAPEVTARPIDEWHEDYGDVLWWTFPIQEPPYCGSPLDIDWPDYHTHWTPLVLPAAPAPKEGTENKCPGCGSHMVPQWGGDEGPDSHWEECQNPDCDYEEGDNQ